MLSDFLCSLLGIQDYSGPYLDLLGTARIREPALLLGTFLLPCIFPPLIIAGLLVFEWHPEGSVFFSTKLMQNYQMGFCCKPFPSCYLSVEQGVVPVRSLLCYSQCFTVEQLFSISVGAKSWEPLWCCKDVKPSPPPWSPCELCKKRSDWGWGGC